jgi:hypothetical protein
VEVRGKWRERGTICSMTHLLINVIARFPSFVQPSLNEHGEEGEEDLAQKRCHSSTLRRPQVTQEAEVRGLCI